MPTESSRIQLPNRHMLNQRLQRRARVAEDVPIPHSARSTIRTIFWRTKPAPMETKPRMETPAMNAYSTIHD